MTDTETESDETNRSRRSVLGGIVALAIAYAAGLFSSAAAAAPTGVFPISTDDPLLKIRADRVRLVPRTSDPSSPDDGTEWYRGDL